MRPTDDLMAEHRVVEGMLDILAAMADRLESGAPIAADDLAVSIEFLRGFVDRCHHGKEEQWLFPALELVGIRREGGPIGVMLDEHRAGRARVQAMAAASDRLGQGDAVAGAEFARQARGYTALLRDHIQKEDRVLYPMGDARLSSLQQAELEEGFERVERETMGHGVHERFHALLHRLSEEYL